MIKRRKISFVLTMIFLLSLMTFGTNVFSAEYTELQYKDFAGVQFNGQGKVENFQSSTQTALINCNSNGYFASNTVRLRGCYVIFDLSLFNQEDIDRIKQFGAVISFYAAPNATANSYYDLIDATVCRINTNSWAVDDEGNNVAHNPANFPNVDEKSLDIVSKTPFVCGTNGVYSEVRADVTSAVQDCINNNIQYVSFLIVPQINPTATGKGNANMNIVLNASGVKMVMKPGDPNLKLSDISVNGSSVEFNNSLTEQIIYVDDSVNVPVMEFTCESSMVNYEIVKSPDFVPGTAVVRVFHPIDGAEQEYIFYLRHSSTKDQAFTFNYTAPVTFDESGGSIMAYTDANKVPAGNLVLVGYDANGIVKELKSSVVTDDITIAKYDKTVAYIIDSYEGKCALMNQATYNTGNTAVDFIKIGDDLFALDAGKSSIQYNMGKEAKFYPDIRVQTEDGAASYSVDYPASFPGTAKVTISAPDGTVRNLSVVFKTNGEANVSNIPTGGTNGSDFKLTVSSGIHEDKLIYNVDYQRNVTADNFARNTLLLVTSDTNNAPVTDGDILGIGIARTDKNGVVSGGINLIYSGNVYMYANSKNPAISDFKSFEVMTYDDYKKMIDEIGGAANTSSCLAKIEEYKDFLTSDSKYYDNLTDKSRVAEYLMSNKNKIDITNVSAYFDKAVAYACAYLNDDEAYTDMLAYYANVFGLYSMPAPYEKVFTSYNDYISKIRPDFISHMKSRYVSTEEEMNDLFAESVIVSAIKNVSKTELDEILTDNAAYLGIEGYLELPNTAKSIVLNNLKKARPDSKNDIKKIYNDSINEINKKQNGGNSGGSGSSSGSSSAGKSSSVSVSKTMADETKPAAPVIPKSGFEDIEGHWAEDAINGLFYKGVINGKSATEFKPEDTVTREEFVKLVVIAFNVDGEARSDIFDDVDSNGWYAPYVGKAYSSDVIKGIGNRLFGVGKNIKREDIVVIISKLLKAETEKIFFFDDSDTISEYAKIPVNALVEKGIIKGGTDNKFRPGSYATRAEACQIIYNAVNAGGYTYE